MSRPKQQLNVRLSAEAFERLSRLCDRDGATQAATIERALAALDGQQREPLGSALRRAADLIDSLGEEQR